MINFKGKKVLFAGWEKGTVACAKYLASQGAQLKLSEIRPKDHLADAVAKLQSVDPKMEMEFGQHSSAFLENVDFIVRATDVSPQTPALLEASVRGVVVTTEIELLAQQTNIPFVAICGGYGKSTVASILTKLLTESDMKVFLSSDLGKPLGELLLQNAQFNFVVLELSPQQIEGLDKFKPLMVIFTNADGNYLQERFSSLEDYQHNYLKVLKNTDVETTIIYNFRDPVLRKLMIAKTGGYSGSNLRLFRRKDPNLDNTVKFPGGYRGAYLVHQRELVLANGENKEVYNLRYTKLFGIYNKENLMAAVIAARAANCSQKAIQNVIDAYPGTAHRLEFVKKKGGVTFINDSRSTGPDSMAKALEAFTTEPIILIAGGKDGQANFTPLVELVKKRVKILILIGEAKESVNRMIGDYAETFLVGTFEEAALIAYQKSREGDIILLSPGCESYDMFVSYEERGNYFKKFVEEL